MEILGRTFRFAAVRFAALATVCGLFAIAGSRAEAAVGFQRLTYTAPGGAHVEAGIWYPSEGVEKPEPLSLNEQDVVTGGAVRGTDLPLVVISHGTGGSFTGHYDTAIALAKAGFVVAALTHPGDNYLDNSRALFISDRPRQVSQLLDFMLEHWSGRASLSTQKVGAFGFSAGGFTVLALVGGRYDLGLVSEHCADHADEWTCKYVANSPVPVNFAVPRADGADTDPRIKAAVVAAPALGYTFGKAGLANVRVPVQLWRAAADEILPQPFYAQAVYDALPVAPQYFVVPGAGHYDFLAPCSAALAQQVPDICTSAPGFDRAAFHRRFNAAVVDFFKENLR
ncbi:alpha/beta hydrolase family protein [Paraburkholderia dinghuensis]|uniref:Dienelactone hydrolase n=1 Tax=Paraburkholderia dinghuensis TaxID=2305225 RepID=A0A3N6N1R1_9BURK|nr:dienelactone hydrolase [Paraburkholderia dinghuensis]RQH04451.1 dienelactone hydrolase [Paraburkholderia dinghuensis]